MLLNLLQLLQSDDQTTYTDKVNYNFDQLLSMGGGPIGPTGFQGIQGVPGTQGVQGFQGPKGDDGTVWYVVPSTTAPNGSSVPPPKIGDFWLQTDTLEVWEYLGSPAMWTNTGNLLSSTGVFSAGGANNLLFTSPSPTRSLVLSPIAYGAGQDSQGGAFSFDYKLKVVGTSGSPMIRLAVADNPSTENLPSEQTKLSVQKLIDANYPSSKNWRFNLENLNGDISFNLTGNNLTIYPQIASVSAFDFGAQVKLQSNAADRLLSFSGTNTGFQLFHVGRHTGLTNPGDKLFSISDNGQVSFGSSFGNAFSNPTSSADFHIDVLGEDLSMSATSPVDWLRLRGRTVTGGGAWDSMVVNHNRLFVDSGGPSNRSSMIKFQHVSGGANYHFIGFTGGSDSASAPLRAQMRMGYNGAYYLSADISGRIGIGDTTFIKTYNNSGSGVFQSKLNIQGNTGPTGGSFISGGTAHGGIHLMINPFTGGGVGQQVGITAGGLGTNQLTTYAGIHFVDQSSTTNQGLDIAMSTGLYANSGETLRRTITRGGDHYWWGKNDANLYMLLEPGGLGTNVNDFMHLSAFESTSNTYKDIIFNRGTDASGFGNGFVGIGGLQGFGEPISATNTLVKGQYYVCVTAASVTFNPGFAPFTTVYNAGDFFSALNSFISSTTVISGTVARAKPFSKLHVNDSVTFGTRKDGAYSTVGARSFTVGNNHTASNTRSIIVGGSGHTSSGTDTVIIGYNGAAGINATISNSIVLATTTNVTTANPTLPSALTVYTSGPVGTGAATTNNYYAPSSSPILNLSTFVTPAGLSMGDMGRSLSLEARIASAADPTKMPVSLEFIARNNSIAYPIGLVSGMLESAAPANGRISVSIIDAGLLYETAYFNSFGLTLVAQAGTSLGAYPSSKIQTEKSKVDGGSGTLLQLTAGDAFSTGGPAVGGNLLLDAGRGAAGGANGSINIGAASSIFGTYSPDSINMTAVTSINATAPTTNINSSTAVNVTSPITTVNGATTLNGTVTIPGTNVLIGGTPPYYSGKVRFYSGIPQTFSLSNTTIVLKQFTTPSDGITRTYKIEMQVSVKLNGEVLTANGLPMGDYTVQILQSGGPVGSGFVPGISGLIIASTNHVLINSGNGNYGNYTSDSAYIFGIATLPPGAIIQFTLFSPNSTTHGNAYVTGDQGIAMMTEL